MLKTLFLSALSLSCVAVASAATILDLDATAITAAAGTYTPTEGLGATGYNAISFTSVLNYETLKSKIQAAGEGSSDNWFRATGGASIGWGNNFVSATGVSGIYGSWQTTIDRTEGAMTTLQAFDWTSYDSVAMTMSISSSGTAFSLTFHKIADDTYMTLYNLDSALKSNGFGKVTNLTWTPGGIVNLTVDNTALNQTQAAAANEAALKAIPEPATASLSLLGLAALMMRRRRA